MSSVVETTKYVKCDYCGVKVFGAAILRIRRKLAGLGWIRCGPKDMCKKCRGDDWKYKF